MKLSYLVIIIGTITRTTPMVVGVSIPTIILNIIVLIVMERKNNDDGNDKKINIKQPRIDTKTGKNRYM